MDDDRRAGVPSHPHRGPWRAAILRAYDVPEFELLGVTMGLFGKRKTDSSGVELRSSVNALILTADAPPRGAPSFGPQSRGTIKAILPGPGGRPQTLESTFKYAEDHWLAAGMDAPALLDPEHPDTFEVDWASVPSMKQRAEANHPALADPFAASRRLADALGITPSEKTASQYERFQQAVTEAAAKPAPAGQLRAVAMIATARGRYDSGDTGDASTGGGGSHPGVGLTGASEAVLSVWVPGRAPYAVFVPKFKVPRKHLSIPGEPIPATVSASDPQKVEILWQEAPGLMDQVAARMTDSARATSRVQQDMMAQYQAAVDQAMAHPPAPAAAPTGMPPAARQMLVENLKRSLAYVTDPAQRQLVLDQYRTMGLDITPEELGH
jgi:hypothetical protein